MAGGGFGQCYNAQAAVAAGSLLVVATDVVQAPNDKQQLAPHAGQTRGAARRTWRAGHAVGGQRLFQRGERRGLRVGWDRSGDRARARGTPLEAMAHRLQTPQGRALYALRKQIPEPVFGIIKSVLGFRQFLLRGLAGARSEWRLVTMARNLKRMFALASAR